MLTKLNILVIFLPFLSVFISSILFLIFQKISNKNYLLNLIVSFFVIFFLILIVTYKINSNISDKEVFYLIFTYICFFWLFLCLIQSQVSSLQLTILRMIYLYPGINKKQILKKYNINNIFKERIERLESGQIIYKKNSSYFIKNYKIILYLNYTKILRRILNIK
jgi:hypothetical protein